MISIAGLAMQSMKEREKKVTEQKTIERPCMEKSRYDRNWKVLSTTIGEGICLHKSKEG